MTDQGPLASKWAESARAFNDGAADAFDSLFAVDCVWNSPQGQIEGSAAIQAALIEIRQALGWQSHEVVGSSEADGLLALLGRNTYASGATVHVAAGVKFVDGKVTEIHSVGGLPDITA
jgi:hypothetical protein